MRNIGNTGTVQERVARRLLIAVMAAIEVLLLACAERHLGYGVLLWSMPEKGLADGDVLLVYIKSNISHVWVASSGNELHGIAEKFEVPLWQMTQPVSKRKADDIAAKGMDYQGKYARVMIDALPIRAEATNSSKRVYRLKTGEVVRVLGEHTDSDGPMELPANGGVPLEGKWLKVITNEGTLGWCFSHNLELFKAARGEAIE